ncbi:riboflavin synthase [Brachybacterium sp. EF45031]|uniref:riboflavin synthase n=1 Tax=Brachybacterium sillae TaxID=2810536 RepID=UPI00217E6170|nr:riboflavin synthase [Brachybacterium sillae]MCS6711904.1 riboflavin synthase [Brachybacterium sillae]
MFTGIITGLGTIRAITHGPDHTATLTLDGPAELLADLPRGGSLAVSGVCLTAVEPVSDPAAAASDTGASAAFTAVAMGETLDRTTLGHLTPGDRVNLERCTRVDDRLDGHVVQGHVDGVGTVRQVEDDGTWRRLRVGIPAGLAGQVAEKGAVALDGVSLTVTAVSDPGAAEPWLEVALIPETLAATTLGAAREGTAVNIETDALAKYTERLLAVRAAEARR